jgi:lysine-specific demethylase 8
MSNTSDVDVFGTDEVVASQVRSAAFRSVLGPGDLLYLPPGWWHSLRSLTRSASVSTWF